jgi:hypothetical protein
MHEPTEALLIITPPLDIRQRELGRIEVRIYVGAEDGRPFAP